MPGGSGGLMVSTLDSDWVVGARALAGALHYVLGQDTFSPNASVPQRVWISNGEFIAGGKTVMD